MRGLCTMASGQKKQGSSMGSAAAASAVLYRLQCWSSGMQLILCGCKIRASVHSVMCGGVHMLQQMAPTQHKCMLPKEALGDDKPTAAAGREGGGINVGMLLLPVVVKSAVCLIVQQQQQQQQQHVVCLAMVICSPEEHCGIMQRQRRQYQQPVAATRKRRFPSDNSRLIITAQFVVMKCSYIEPHAASDFSRCALSSQTGRRDMCNPSVLQGPCLRTV